jgi:hypothetical protein
LKAVHEASRQLKTGKIYPYLDASTFELNAGEVTDPSRRWLSVPDLLVGSMGKTPRNVILIDQVNELKGVSQTAPQSKILVIADGAGEIDRNRAELVAKAAKSLGIEINVIWAGSGNTAANAKVKKYFSSMSTMTDGAFLDISSSHGCSIN